MGFTFFFEISGPRFLDMQISKSTSTSVLLVAVRIPMIQQVSDGAML
jgi:hypothetical protein